MGLSLVAGVMLGLQYDGWALAGIQAYPIATRYQPPDHGRKAT